jgi:hypothetical protein
MARAWVMTPARKAYYESKRRRAAGNKRAVAGMKKAAYSKRLTENVRKMRASAAKKKARSTPTSRQRAAAAFKERYLRSRSLGNSKEESRRQAYTTAAQTSRAGRRMNYKYGYGLARTKGKITSKSGRKQFARGYSRAATQKWR